MSRGLASSIINRELEKKKKGREGKQTRRQRSTRDSLMLDEVGSRVANAMTEFDQAHAESQVGTR